MFVNVRLKIKALRVKFITIILSGDGDGLWKSMPEHFIGKYKYYNINTDILKCTFQSNAVHLSGNVESLERPGLNTLLGESSANFARASSR